ncbi:MAG: Tetratricopeptide repeat [Acidobacteriota bacterium]|nr:Tetratricopeptide repeat [Acidobacteriota bacterium]
MTKRTILLVLAAALLAASCTTVDKPAPVMAPESRDPYLVDPRAGFHDGAPDPQLEKKFDTAWRWALSGNEPEARTRLADILRTNPEYLPARLALAAVDIRADRYDEAQANVAEVLAADRNYLAARVYEAEIATRQRNTRRAYELYRDVVTLTDAPASATERLRELGATLYGELFASAQTAAPAEAIRLLREALTLNAGANEARLLLGQKLVAQKQWEEARRALDPLLNGADVDRPEVQEMLAEIDTGRGRYQEAIVRYDRLARRTRDPRYNTRLEEIKEEWSAQNMPSHFRQALESEALTRAELAVLLYWKVPSIRFAQNLNSPPIAIDVADVSGREEMIRAIALGLYDVDPVTRRVGPHRQVTAERLSRLLARVLQLRAAPCARGIAVDRVLAACGVPDPLTGTDPNALVSGRTAARLLEPIANALQ